MAKPATRVESEPPSGTRETLTCGIVRPIADFAPYPTGHWVEVHDIIDEALQGINFEARLVSDSESPTVIIGNIVTNLYNDPIVICDVSGRNPNVMFELGMRVAFEKPVIIVTDDITPFSFDISIIKHLVYPHSLRFKEMVAFKKELSEAVMASVEVGTDPKRRGYLQQFGPIEATELGVRSVSGEEIVQDIQEIRRSIRALERQTPLGTNKTSAGPRKHFVNVDGIEEVRRDEIVQHLLSLSTVQSADAIQNGDMTYIAVSAKPGVDREQMMNEIRPARKALGLNPHGN